MAHGEREGRRRDLVGFKNKCYENASCGLVVQTSAVHVDALVTWGPSASLEPYSHGEGGGVPSPLSPPHLLLLLLLFMPAPSPPPPPSS